MQEQLNLIAEDTGVPAELLERAARARAEKQGVDVEALVAGWSGGEAPAPAATPESAPAPAEPAADSGAGKLPEGLLRRSAAAKAKREGRPLDEVLVEMGLSPEGSDAAPTVEPAAAPAAEAAPATAVTEADEPAPVEEPEEEPELVFAGFPRWLAASFVLIPMLALLYAGLAPNGPDCGTSGQLAINPINGEAESCDGGASPFFTQGEAIYDAQCASCHGSDGSGGVGPSFLGGAVIQTFAACSDHVEWVTTGSSDWPDATYGDTAKPVLGTGVAMPGYASSLSEQQIAAVSLYERVAFGGEDIATAEASCGFVAGTEGGEG
ncbi:MAG: cytochrome c [bacterium]|nr:cytochrome c [bacterium]